MPTTPATADTVRPSVDEQFFELICNDAELLAAEFDAIIAAEWPAPPPSTPGRGTAGDHPTGGAARRAIASRGSPLSRSRRRGVGERVRQRSPPGRRNNSPLTRKAGDRPT